MARPFFASFTLTTRPDAGRKTTVALAVLLSCPVEVLARYGNCRQVEPAGAGGARTGQAAAPALVATNEPSAFSVTPPGGDPGNCAVSGSPLAFRTLLPSRPGGGDANRI